MRGELDISPSGRIIARNAPAATPAMVRLVERLRRGPPDVPVLVEAFSERFTFDDVRPYVRFDHAGYVRALICAQDSFELRLLCWLPGQSTTLHAHGASACAFRVLRGTATEIVLGARDRVLAPGSVLVEDGPRVHQVMNAGRDPLLTLHAYSPPLALARERPRTEASTRTVAIVGAGFAGAALAYHLLREGDAGLRVHLIERGPWLGRGIAYGVESDVFRLNVPASRMSLDPEAPDDFVRFAETEHDPHAFLERARYGQYVITKLGEAVRARPGQLRVWRGEAVAVDDRGVQLVDGARVPAEAVVLATGFAPRSSPATDHPRMIDAWDECALATLPRDGEVLLVGSGLSALDVLAFLDAQGFRGHVTVVSPRGHLPSAHEAGRRRSRTRPLPTASALQALALDLTTVSLRGAFASVRRHLRDAEARGSSWRAAFDELRPALTALYQAMPVEERARFVRHVRPYWDLARHRAAPEVLERARAWESRGALRLLAGRVETHARADGARGAESLDVSIHLRDGSVRDVRFDAGVRCLGPALDHRESETTLVRALVSSGRAQIAHGALGLATDPEGRLLTGGGSPSDRLFALGAPRRGTTWESTSAPDIVAQARALATLLLGT